MPLNKISKIFFKIVVIFLIIIFFCLFFSNSLKETQEVKLTFFDVGQGDACLVNLKNKKNILIDGGPDNLVLRDLGSELNFFEKKIDFILVSHFHSDHVIGLIEIFKRFKVNYLIYGKDLKQFYPTELLFLEAKKQNTKIIEVEKEINIFLEDDCKLIIINPAEFSASKSIDDNTSLLSKIDCQGFTFLSAGDNEQEIEGEIIKSGLDISAQVFKASHHGSKTSNSKEFIEVINPKIMVFSAGIDNKFGHPSPEVIDRVNYMGIELMRTDKSGTVHIFAQTK